ncbi:MAG: caspase family protein [Elusimicrobia bacterium]|nr:caspase family protein [Elusimicrobiota bacterium]
MSALLGAAACASANIARNPNIDVNRVRRVAVVPFAEDAAQGRVTGEWQTVLTALGYRVIERGDIDLLLKEHGLALSGIVNPDEAAKIGEMLGVEGIVLGRPGSKPYITYNMMSQQETAEPPPLSVKLIDAGTARALWSVTSQEKGEHSANILRQGNAVEREHVNSLRKTLKAGGWSSFPPSSYLHWGSGVRIAFNPAIKHSRRLRIGVYPFKAENRKDADLWADKMSNALLNAGYDVIDRVQLQALMKEQKFSLSGAVKPEQMAALGEVAGIQALVFGAVYGDPVCAYAVRLADLTTGELYWSAFGEGCELDAFSSALQSSLAKLQDRAAEGTGAVQPPPRPAPAAMEPPSSSVREKPPFRIVISKPADGLETAAKQVGVSGFVEGSVRIERMSLNGKPVERKRGLSVVSKAQGTFPFEENVPLVFGQNYIIVEAVDSSGLAAKSQVLVVRKQAAPEAQPSQARLPTLWVVVIGINRYQDTGVQELRFASKDAEAVSAFFDRQEKLGVYKAVKKRLLIDEAATLSAMRKAMGEFFLDAREDDIAVVFFAGHGFVDKVGDAFLLAANSKLDSLYSTALPMKEFKDLLSSRIPPKRTLVLADACHSGGMGAGLRGSDQIVADFQRLSRETQGKVIVTASREREFSRENEAKGHGVFTYYFLKALEGGGDKNDDGIVTLGEAYDFLYEKVVEDTGGAQHPTMPAGGFDNEMPIAAIR